MTVAKRPRRWLFLIPLALGIALAVTLVKGRSGPEQAAPGEIPRVVRVIEAPLATVVPRVLGYGRVKPGRVWDGVAEVSGRILEVNPRLRRGVLLDAGELLLRIDPADFHLAVVQAEADILATRAQRQELVVQEGNIRALLALEEQNQRLRESELERKTALAQRGSVSPSELEQEKRNLLVQRQSVQAQRNALDLVAAQAKTLEAQQARHEARLAEAQLNLERTEVRLPLRARIAEQNVEQAQYVRQGEVMLRADGIELAEIEAQIPITEMRRLLRSERSYDLGILPMETLRDAVALSARVWLRGDGTAVSWEARVARLSDTLDPKTRTIGVIVEVDNPYGDIRPGARPPLVKGMFTAVELRGIPRPESLLIPRTALHGDRVYVAGPEDRLEVRPVTLDLVAAEYAVVTVGLAPGARVVVSDLFPAVEGMRLAPQPDPQALAVLLRAAAGED